MGNIKCILLCLVLVSIGATGCHVSKKATARHSKQPKFLDDVYIGKHEKGASTPNAIDHNTRNPERHAPKKSVTKRPEPDVLPSEKRALKEKYASTLGVSKQDITNTTLYSFIDEWYGTRYQYGGFTKAGIDCSGFVKTLFRDVYNIDLAHSSDGQYQQVQKTKSKNAQEGDLLFFRTRGRRISHVGVYLWNDYFVHASTSKGVVISSLNEEYWREHLAGVGTMK
jgi:cell wall-associated NlpC family hydrolase